LQATFLVFLAAAARAGIIPANFHRRFVPTFAAGRQQESHYDLQIPPPFPILKPRTDHGVSPFHAKHFVNYLVLTTIVTSLIGLVVMIVLATLAFGLSFFAYGLTLVPFLLILFLFGIALGICAAAMVLRLGPAAEWFVWPIPALVSPFAGVFYPLSTLPHWMQFIGKLLPVSYVFEGLRTIISGAAVPLLSLLVSGCLAVICVLLACWYFRRVYRRAMRTGILVRYTAESVS